MRRISMDRNTLTLVGVVILIAVVGALVTYLRSENMATPADIATRGLVIVQRDAVLFYGLFLPVVVGVISWFVYKGMYGQSPDTAARNLLLLAIGIGIGFTVLAAVVFKMRGFSEFLVLHIVYAAGFGWIMPRLLTL
jgi:hypothetical protein